MAAHLFSAGDVALNYRVEGTGPQPLVCIHGVGSYLEAWSGVVARLPRQFTVLSFDLRGHGRSTRVKGRYEIDDFVSDALALADHVGFHSFHLAGFSLGGLIAQRLALIHPGRLRRLVLLSTIARRLPGERRAVLGRLAALSANKAGAHHAASLSRWLTEDFQRQNPDVIAELRRRDAENDPGCYAAAYRVLAETDFGGILDQIRSPTLVVTGEDDQGSNPRMARHMHDQIRGSQLRILPGLRHSILVEAPAQVAGLVADFLVENAQRAEAGGHG